MVMGSEQEDRTLVRYLQHKRENGQPDIAVQKAGFIIDKDYGWLGAYQMQWLLSTVLLQGQKVVLK